MQVIAVLSGELAKAQGIQKQGMDSYFATHGQEPPSSPMDGQLLNRGALQMDRSLDHYEVRHVP